MLSWANVMVYKTYLNIFLCEVMLLYVPVFYVVVITIVLIFISRMQPSTHTNRPELPVIYTLTHKYIIYYPHTHLRIYVLRTHTDIIHVYLYIHIVLCPCVSFVTMFRQLPVAAKLSRYLFKNKNFKKTLVGQKF